MAGWWKVNQRFLVCLGLAVVTFVVFYQVHSFRFVNLDDPDYVYNNPNVQDGLTLKALKWAYLGYVERPKAGNYLWILVLYGLGLMAKPMLVTLPLALLLLDYWPLGRLAPVTARLRKKHNRKPSASYLVIEKFPLSIIAIISSIITFFVQKKGGAMNIGESYDLGAVLFQMGENR